MIWNPELTEACRRTQAKYLRGLVGKTVDVLFEREPDEPIHAGHTPEYVLVKVPRRGGETLWKQLLPVRVTDAGDECVYGELETEV